MYYLFIYLFFGFAGNMEGLGVGLLAVLVLLASHINAQVRIFNSI